MTLTQNPETSRLLGAIKPRYQREFGWEDWEAIVKNCQKFQRFGQLPKKQQDQLNYIRKLVGV